MSTNEICELEIIRKIRGDRSVLFLWATNPFLEDAFKVIQAWGFTYKTNMAWVKNRMGAGFYVRGQHELLLIATRGNRVTPDPSNRISSYFRAPIRKHSQKPTRVYDFIERMYPNAKYYELFARQRRKGWEAWGNEVNV